MLSTLDLKSDIRTRVFSRGPYIQLLCTHQELSMEFEHKRIGSRSELIQLLNKLSSEDTSKWENISTRDFLDAMASWLESAEHFYRNFELDINAKDPSWQLFADAIQAATIYE